MAADNARPVSRHSDTEDLYAASPPRSATPQPSNTLEENNVAKSELPQTLTGGGNGENESQIAQHIDNLPCKTNYHSPTVETASEESSLHLVPDEMLQSAPTYHSPTVETASEGSSLYPVREENFTFDDSGSIEISTRQAFMSGALSENPIFLPALPLDDHVRDSNSTNQAPTDEPRKKTDVVEHTSHPLPVYTRGWYVRNARDFESFSSSPFTSRARRHHREPVQVLSSSPVYQFVPDRPIFRVLELRSNIIGRYQPGLEANFHWQLCRYYSRQALLPPVTEQYEGPEFANEEGQAHVVPNNLFSQILDGVQILPFSDFEHLKHGNFKKFPPRHANGGMTCVDYVAGTTIPRIKSTFWGIDEARVPWDLQPTNPNEFLGHLWGPIPDNVKTRLLIVEDLSWVVIRFLGTRFHVSPEFFEEHLVNSGYRDGKYEDPPTHSWKTYNIKKDYISIKWYRPVIRQEDTPPISNRSEEDLLRTGFLSYDTGERERHIYRTETNIFRPKWDLETDPYTPPAGQRSCGWEERASVWSREVENCRVVILILDPLPTLARGILQRNAVSATLSSYASIIDVEQASEVQQKLMLDQHHQVIFQPAHLKSRPPPKVPTRFEKLGLRFLRWLKRKENVSERSSSGDVGHLAKNFQKLNSVLLFQQVSARVDLSTEYRTAFSSVEQIQAFSEKALVTRSTVTDFLDWLDSPLFRNAYRLAPFGAAAPLLQLVITDTLSFCRLVHNGLNQISEDIIDEEKLEESLFIWRQFIGRCQRELPELQSSIIRLRAELYPEPKNPTAGTHDMSKIDHLEKEIGSVDLQFQELLGQITNLREEVSKATNSLTSNMSLLDSKRSIQEARSVTKLTELAFVFIPLTFAASIFGMQIDSFTNRAPLWVFIVLALAITILSYTVRLVIRSHTILYAKSRAVESLVLYAKEYKVPYRRGQPVPTGLFVSWVLYKIRRLPGYLISLLGSGILRLWSVIGFWVVSALMISLLAAAPLAVLLTRNFNAPLKKGLSVMIVVISSSIIVIPYWRSSAPEFRSALPRLIYAILSLIVRNDIFQLALYWLIGLAAAATPLILVWTRNLAIGVKAAVTTLLVMGLVSMIVAFVIYRLVVIARTRFIESDSDDDHSLSLEED